MYLLTTRHLTETTASAAILARQVLRKAVIPAAGLGRRMSSLTGGAPKEIFPVEGRQITHHAGKKEIDAGLVEICKRASKRFAVTLKATIRRPATWRAPPRTYEADATSCLPIRENRGVSETPFSAQ